MQQQKQAEQAIQYYFAYTQSSRLKKENNHKNITSPNTISENRQEYEMLESVSPKSRGTSNKEIPIEIKGSDWTGVFTKRQNSIRVRHYSQTTWKTYSGWVRKFQAFTKSKDPRLLGTEDVKEF